jgi:Methyltransferase domain
MSDYQALLMTLNEHRVQDVPGDVVEIGAFVGGGTYQLCKFFKDKHVYAIDIFDPDFDLSITDAGKLSEVYRALLTGSDQRTLYDEITASCANLTTLAVDSARATLPCKRIAYAHIDGNHDPAYVRKDFEIVWSKVSPGGIVSFDDYSTGRMSERVTRAVDALIADHDVERVWTIAPKTIFLLKQAPAADTS